VSRLYCDTLPTPIGPLSVVVDEGGALTRLLFAGAAPPAGAELDPTRCGEATAQLRAYLSGARRSFDLPLAPARTAFQRRVREALLAIPAGETVDYATLAARIGRPGAARAVGRANATNPVPIVVPCHRVMGRDGSPTGYAGGIAAKLALLRIERSAAPSP
jgi:methylated-DNA-[protein]-cysteine S-methyltransferase